MIPISIDFTHSSLTLSLSLSLSFSLSLSSLLGYVTLSSFSLYWLIGLTNSIRFAVTRVSLYAYTFLLMLFVYVCPHKMQCCPYKCEFGRLWRKEMRKEERLSVYIYIYVCVCVPHGQINLHMLLLEKKGSPCILSIWLIEWKGCKCIIFLFTLDSFLLSKVFSLYVLTNSTL